MTGDSAFATYGTVHPSHQIAYVGNPVTISCSGNTNTHWYYNGEEISFYYMKDYDPQASELTAVVYIKNVTSEHDGKYTCSGWRIEDNEILHWLEDGYLKVVGNEANCKIKTKVNLWTSYKIIRAHIFVVCATLTKNE